MTMTLYGTLRLRTPQEGGGPRDGFSGMHPSLNVDGDLIMAQVHTVDGQSTIAMGQDIAVKIDLAYGERYQGSFCKPARFLLQVGGRVIGDFTLSVGGDMSQSLGNP